MICTGPPWFTEKYSVTFDLLVPVYMFRLSSLMFSADPGVRLIAPSPAAPRPSFFKKFLLDFDFFVFFIYFFSTFSCTTSSIFSFFTSSISFSLFIYEFSLLFLYNFTLLFIFFIQTYLIENIFTSLQTPYTLS